MGGNKKTYLSSPVKGGRVQECLKVDIIKKHVQEITLNVSGDFVCQVSAFKPTQIQHTVKIRGENIYILESNI